MRNALSLSLVVIALAGCGGAPATRRAGLDASRLEPRNLYPLQDGYVWAYTIDTQTGAPTIAAFAAHERNGAFEVAVSGGEPGEIKRYEVRPDGIYRPDRDVYLLRAPIEVGASWASVGGATARVTSVTEAVDVPAGHYEGCVVVEESGMESGLTQRTVYCAGVGPAIVESTQPLQLRSPITIRGQLLSFNRGEEDAEVDPIDAP